MKLIVQYWIKITLKFSEKHSIFKFKTKYVGYL